MKADNQVTASVASSDATLTGSQGSRQDVSVADEKVQAEVGLSLLVLMGPQEPILDPVVIVSLMKCLWWDGQVGI